MRKVFLLLALLCCQSAHAEELQCTADDKAQFDACVDAAVQSCHDALSQCSARELRVDQVMERAKQRCYYKPNQVLRTKGACRACLTSIIVDLGSGPSKFLWPLFTAQVNQELRELRAACGEDSNAPDPNATPTPTPKERFCENHPNAAKCK